MQTLIEKVLPSGGKKYHKEFDTVNEMLEYWKKYAKTHNDITKTDFQRLIFCKDVKMYFILRNYNLVLARVTPTRTIQEVLHEIHCYSLGKLIATQLRVVGLLPFGEDVPKTLITAHGVCS